MFKLASNHRAEARLRTAAGSEIALGLFNILGQQGSERLVTIFKQSVILLSSAGQKLTKVGTRTKEGWDFKEFKELTSIAGTVCGPQRRQITGTQHCQTCWTHKDRSAIGTDWAVSIQRNAQAQRRSAVNSSIPEALPAVSQR